MFEKRLSKSIYFSVIFLIGLVTFVGFTIYKQYSESGSIFGLEDASAFEYWFIIAAVGLICLVCLSSVFVLLRQITKFNNTAFTVDHEGIHDTFISVTIFAFILILPVKLIPWNAVKEIKNDDGDLSLEINRKEVVASPVAKIILGIFGYNFCRSSIKDLEESEKKIVMNYCGIQTDDSVFEERENEVKEKTGYTYSTGFKIGMNILLILNLLFVVFTFFNYSGTAEMSCYLNTIFSGILGFENSPVFAEYFQIANNEMIVYFKLEENFLYYYWTIIKLVHIVVIFCCYYHLRAKQPKFSAKKLSLFFVAASLFISLAGFTTLQFAVHNRIEANENCIISSKFNKEDVIISNYKDAEKVEVYIPEIEEGEDDYSAYENAIIDVTVKGQIYSFYTDENTTAENIEKFISFFDKSIVVIIEVS